MENEGVYLSGRRNLLSRFVMRVQVIVLDSLPGKIVEVNLW